MSIDQIAAEQEATESLIKLLEAAKRCQMFFDRAHMVYPEPLKRVLGHATSNGVPHSVALIPSPVSPPMPTGAKSDWIWVKQEECTVKNVVLAILRSAGGVVRVKDLAARVKAILPQANHGTINNIGTKLGGKLIQREEDGWRLLNHDSAGILHDGYLWAPKNVLIYYELAAHRRDAILHILTFFHGGLQPRQLLEQLRKCAWIHAPISKDLLKADLEVMAEDNKIRRVGNSGKWELAPTKDS